jgi:catechol 2,3-dioxygenase-like lactoylglutathione lyase family enzyme
VSLRGFDHAAIPIQRVDAMLAFYRALGFGVAGEAPRWSAHLGDQKLNFHGPAAWQSAAFALRGPTALPGCGDFCFVWDGTADALRALLDGAGVALVAGPVERVGGRDGGRARGTSFYVRDPDRNLLEFILYSA